MRALILFCQSLLVACSFPDDMECDRAIQDISSRTSYDPQLNRFVRKLQRAESSAEVTRGLAAIHKLSEIAAQSGRELEMAKALRNAELDGLFAEAACGAIGALLLHETRRTTENCSDWRLLIRTCDGLIASTPSTCPDQVGQHR